MILTNFLKKINKVLGKNKIKILFETDFEPKRYLKFIKNFNKKFFGINYDIGNSASYNFDPNEEISLYGKYIDNVHVKDRITNGTTVPLGEGSANFTEAFEQLHSVDYSGNYILQTARAEDGNHAAVLKSYKSMVKGWIVNNES